MIIELSDDEMNTLREAFDDVGCDCPSVDWDKFKALGIKLGFWEAKKPPTEEELKRREELYNSPNMIKFRELLKQTSLNLAKEQLADLDILYGQKSLGRVQMPNNYTLKDKE